jgi:hypothetical protein
MSKYVKEWNGFLKDIKLDDINEDDAICLVVYSRPLNRWYCHISTAKDFKTSQGWHFNSNADALSKEEILENLIDYEDNRLNENQEGVHYWFYNVCLINGVWTLDFESGKQVYAKVIQDLEDYRSGEYEYGKEKPSPIEKGKPNGEELYQDGISLQNERVKLNEQLGYKVIAGYVHDKSDLLIYDKKDRLLKVESFKCFKLDKQRRSGSHCRTITRDDLTPEIRDSLNYHVPLFLTIQNILDKEKIMSFQIDPQTFDHWTTPPELAIE